MSNQRFLLIRTYKPVGAGGPVPPLGLLYIASSIRSSFAGRYELKVLDTGIGALSLEDIERELIEFTPHFIGLSSLTCESDLMHQIARLAKKIVSNAIVIVGGPHTLVARERLLDDENIDFGIIGEGERTIVELMTTLEKCSDLSMVNGIVYRRNNSGFLTRPRGYIERLDELPFPSWDLIDIEEYAEYSNWNGITKEKFYFPLFTSRGCSYNCTYCHNIFGKTVRVRSPDNVFSEVMFLYDNYHAKEFHIIDDLFNFDIKRSKEICSLLIESKKNFSLAFPNGLRADIMTEELIALLRRAGTYKINYAVETVTGRLQEMIKKNIDIPRTINTIEKTTRTGIITGGFFMLGFPTETKQEMLQTIDAAVNSDLDIAYFFKATSYPGREGSLPFRNSMGFDHTDEFKHAYFYSSQGSSADISTVDLNNLILEAQQRFFLNLKRLWRMLRKTPHKALFLKDLISMVVLILQSYLLRKVMGNTVKSGY